MRQILLANASSNRLPDTGNGEAPLIKDPCVSLQVLHSLGAITEMWVPRVVPLTGCGAQTFVL